MKKILAAVLAVVIIAVGIWLQVESYDRGFDTPLLMIYSDIKYGRDGEPGKSASTEKVLAVNREYDFRSRDYTIYVEADNPDVKNISKIVATYDYVYYEENSGTAKIRIKVYDKKGKNIQESFRKEMFTEDGPKLSQRIITFSFTYLGEDGTAGISASCFMELHYADKHNETTDSVNTVFDFIEREYS